MQWCCLFLFWCDEFITFTVDIDDFNLWVILQMLAQLGDIHIHRTGIEVVVVNPDGLQGEVALQDSFSLVVNLVCWSPMVSNCFWVSNTKLPMR